MVLRCVCARSEDQAGLAYVMMGLMNCLYIVVIDSLECPYVVVVSARMTFSLPLALFLMLVICGLNVMPVSYVAPRIVVLGVRGMGVLLSVTCGRVWYSLLYGVISVREDLFAETFILLFSSQTSSVPKYC